MSVKLDRLSSLRENIFVGEMEDETLTLSNDQGDTQTARVLGRFCIRNQKYQNSYVVLLAEEDGQEEAIIYRWNTDYIEVIDDKEEWEIVSNTWKSILATALRGEKEEL